MGWKWFKFLRAPTGSIPAASTLQQSTPIYDTTLDVLQISDGVSWQKVWTTKNSIAGSNTGLDADTVSGAGITAGKKVWTTTSAAGDDGNGGQPPAPKCTYSTIDIPNSTPTTILTFPAVAAMYEVFAYVGNDNALSASGHVSVTAAGDVAVTQIRSSIYFALSASGANLQLTNTAGYTVSVNVFYRKVQ